MALKCGYCGEVLVWDRNSRQNVYECPVHGAIPEDAQVEGPSNGGLPM